MCPLIYDWFMSHFREEMEILFDRFVMFAINFSIHAMSVDSPIRLLLRQVLQDFFISLQKPEY